MPKPPGEKDKKHREVMPYADIPAFVARLREIQKTPVRDRRSNPPLAALALEFIILTAVRSGEALEAVWDEIDLENKVWSIPAKSDENGHRASGAAHRFHVVRA